MKMFQMKNNKFILFLSCFIFLLTLNCYSVKVIDQQTNSQGSEVTERNYQYIFSTIKSENTLYPNCFRNSVHSITLNRDPFSLLTFFTFFFGEYYSLFGLEPPFFTSSIYRHYECSNMDLDKRLNINKKVEEVVEVNEDLKDFQDSLKLKSGESFENVKVKVLRDKVEITYPNGIIQLVPKSQIKEVNKGN
jgi:hypothetical protein